MTDRFVPTQKEEHTEIFELTFRENYCDGQPETPERVERFTTAGQARQWASEQSIHVISFAKVVKLAW